MRSVELPGMAAGACSAGACSAGASVSWGEMLDEARRSLTRAGSDAPDVEARRIAAEAADTDSASGSTGFIGLLEKPPTAKAAARFDSLLARRCAGEPLQYVLGRWGFRTLDLLVDRRVLIPRPETEVVAGWAISAARDRSASSVRSRQIGPSVGADDAEPNGARRGGYPVRVVDLGTGSGAIALSVAAECRGAWVFATDVSEDALAVARANLAGLGSVSERVALHVGDWFGALPRDLMGSLDVVVSNPPYVGDREYLPPVVSDWEPRLALRAGPRGGEYIEEIVGQAPRWLRPGGALVVEIPPRLAETALLLARRAGFAARIEQDLAGRDRVLVGVG